MNPSLEPPRHRAFCTAEFAGRFFLAQLDVSQRMGNLYALLGMGLTDCALRSHVLRATHDAAYTVDLNELDSRKALLLEASLEGFATILRNFAEEVAAAHVRCLEQALGRVPSGAPSALPPALLPFLQPDFANFGRAFNEALRERAEGRG